MRNLTEKVECSVDFWGVPDDLWPGNYSGFGYWYSFVFNSHNCQWQDQRAGATEGFARRTRAELEESW